MGLTHPQDLRAWQRWQDSRHPARSVLTRVRPRPARGVLTRGGEAPDVLVALDSGSPSNRAALLAPVAHLPRERVAVLAPPGLAPTSAGWRSAPWSADTLDRSLDSVRLVVSAGHYLPLGGAGFALATSRDVPFVVVQHGLLTPHAPPLPPSARLLAWSEADVEFWCAGRDDVRSAVVGAQLLWEATAAAGGDDDVPRTPAGPPTYLGQLHGAELPRPVLAAAAEAFCRETGASYRPHPSERDRASRRQHARWEAAGIVVERDGPPLAELGTPVVSVFSTGVLEAAARGLPAWVELPDPPPWLAEFWARYGMRRWGEDPTPAPPLPATAPAQLVARAIEGLL
ncbi:RNA-binding protein [Nocardioides mangrovicus]|uniref:RNA-binding protein n=1 Tax=Nocardioides mangrovicus TaxID=2478913 RepID=A0A3L8NYW5_9ACTN|nr:RNA-binding protein [Nocardioides mangrovicus]RLV48355.1 RNA-binding protein [Nocardioides mangrovicus]